MSTSKADIAYTPLVTHPPRICEQCGASFTPGDRYLIQKYCTPECRIRHGNKLRDAKLAKQRAQVRAMTEKPRNTKKGVGISIKPTDDSKPVVLRTAPRLPELPPMEMQEMEAELDAIAKEIEAVHGSRWRVGSPGWLREQEEAGR
jgi:hypothetical protein